MSKRRALPSKSHAVRSVLVATKGKKGKKGKNLKQIKKLERKYRVFVKCNGINLD